MSLPTLPVKLLARQKLRHEITWSWLYGVLEESHYMRLLFEDPHRLHQLHLALQRGCQKQYARLL